MKILGILISSFMVELAFVGLLFIANCAGPRTIARFTPRANQGCELALLDFGTGRGTECYCKIVAYKEDQTKAYIYMVTEAEDCN